MSVEVALLVGGGDSASGGGGAAIDVIRRGSMR